MSEWQPIESAPRDGTHILIRIEWEPEFDYGWPAGQKLSVFEALFHDGDWITVISDNDFGVASDPSFTATPARLLPTHWQPLPLPPADDGAEALTA